jgi:Mce-associated membrane protein
VTADEKDPKDDTVAVPSETEAVVDAELTTSTGEDVEPSETDTVLEPSETDTVVEPSETDSEAESVAATEQTETTETEKTGINWPRVLAFGVLPVLALILGAAAGFLKWQDSSVRDTNAIRTESMQIAKDASVKLLSYKPDTVEQDLGSARELLTGEFRESYTQLINDVVIPGSKEKQISAVATVPAAASVSAEHNKAVVLVFVNQTVVVGTDAPTATTSSVQVTMDRVDDRWLISEFNPV